jgi:hypothetical protein
MSKKATNDALRSEWVAKLIAMLGDEDVQLAGSNEIAIPVVDGEGEDNWITITVKVPTGSRDGDPYDGYAMAEEYRMKQAEKKEKADKAAKANAAKIARDEAMRAKRAEAKAKREG